MQDKHRRKSLSIFRPSLSGLAPIRDNASPPPPLSSESGRAGVLKKKLRPTSLMSPSTTASSPLPLKRADSSASQQSVSSPGQRVRPSSRSRPSRPSSIFGSIKSIHSLQSMPDDDYSSSLGHSTTRTSWGTTNFESGLMLDTERMVLLNHGEVIVGGGMFNKKKNQYLVLTNTHLLRFRSQAKASEVFPGLSPPSSSSGSESNAHLRKHSNSSVSEISADELLNIPVRQIVAVYKIDEGKSEGKNSGIIEIAHLDEISNSTSTLSVQFQDANEVERWLTAVRSAVAQGRACGGLPYSRRAVEYVARTLESDGDYDPTHFQMYAVVQREKKGGSRSSSDDLGKLLSSMSYLVIGYYKMHLVPLLRPTKSSSSTSISDLTGSSYGLAALSSVTCSSSDDTIQLGFRLPLQASSSISFASVGCHEIAASLRNAIEFLRPLYLEQPLSWKSPAIQPKSHPPTPPEIDDHLAFDRTLTAYCMAYKLDPSNIRYTVSYFGEDTPEFQLLDPANVALRPNYTVLELLAIFRALRYNDSFTSISFKGIKLDALHGLVDRFGSEHLCWKTKSGHTLDRPHAERLSLLVQETQNIAVQNERLRRIDFSDSLSNKRAEDKFTERASTEVVEALMPLCSQRLTNIDWVCLNGLALSELDVSSLYSATLKRGCEFRALELGNGALGFEGLRVVAEGLQNQSKTIECINISGCTTKIDQSLVESLACFKRLRFLDMSRCQPAVSSVAFIPYSILSNWRLESLKLSATPLSQPSVDDLSAYLTDNQSSNLRELSIDQCQVSGGEIALLLESATKGRDEPRKLLMDVSKNRIAQDQHMKIVGQVRSSQTPEQLIMKSLEYTREEDFRALLDAVGQNTTLKYLDMSSVALPFDAGEETCDALRMMLEENETLEELNISGEMAALEAATIGKGFPAALKGLASNATLRILHCRHQALGLPGASALASVLEQNDTLEELHCDDNGISLQGFTALVNALESNKSLLYLPSMDGDRKFMTDKVNREINAILGGQGSLGPSSSSSSSKSSSSLRRSVTGLASYRPHAALRSSSSRSMSSKSSDKSSGSNGHSNPASSTASLPAGGYTEQDLAAAVTKFDDTWEAETTRMQTYLYRNMCLAQGLGPDGSILEEAETQTKEMRIPLTAAEAGFVLPPVAELGESRPPTAGSLAAAIAKASLDRTPTAEFDRQLGAPTKLTVGASVIEKGISLDGLDNESALIDTPVQGDFGPIFGHGEDFDTLVMMSAK